MQEEAVIPVCLLEVLPNELVCYIMGLLLEGLTTPKLHNGMGRDLLVSFHSVHLVSKSMEEVARDCLKRMTIDWYAVLDHMLRPSDQEAWVILGSEVGSMREEVVKITRTQLYYYAQLPLIKREVEAFTQEHQITLPVKDHRGHISIKALKRVKVSPKNLKSEYRKIIRSYERTKLKERLLHLKLQPIHHKLKKLAFIRYVLRRAERLIGIGFNAIMLDMGEL